MGLYRDETGRLIDVDDRFAEARGYASAAPEEIGSQINTAAEAARGEDRGLLGTANAAVTGAASSLTFGGSDYLLGETLTPLQRQRLSSELEAHPTARMAGEIGGALAGGAAMPGSAFARTPAGYLGSRSAIEIERALAEGGVKGTARALGVMGMEGATQSAGQYIGHSAIEDKEVTIEGFAGAAGAGFAFGAGGGGAMLGVVKGTISARRMFSRVMDGERAATQAESAWTIARQEALDGDAATARTAEIKLDEIRKAKMEAMRARNEARAMTREEQMRAATSEGRAAVTEDGTIVAPAAEGPVPLDEGITPAKGGGVTAKYQRPDIKFDPNDAASFDAGMPAARDQINDVASTIEPVESGAKTGAFKRPEGSTARIARQEPEAPTELEAQLAGTKKAVDEGAALKDVKPSKGNESSSIEGWLGEKKTFDNAELSGARRIEDLRGASVLRMERLETLAEIRYKATEDLLGAPAAKMEREISDAMDEFNEAKKGFDEISDGVPVRVDDQHRGVLSPDEDFIPPTWPPPPPGMGSTTADRLAWLQRIADGKAAKLPGARSLKPVAEPKPGATAAGSPRGRRQAIEVVDDAHEEALLRAKYAADPQDAGKAVQEAAELERLLDDVSNGVPRQYADDALGHGLVDDIEKIWRYEQASANLADVIGEQAHITSAMRGKALREAEKDSMRKVMDRAARVVDDASEFGPAYKSPKERVRYAKEQQNAAQRHLDEVGVREQEARDAYGQANKKVRAGERDMKAAKRSDAKLAASAGKFGAQDAGGIMEIIDLPGIPKPSDLPVVGPLLGAWLKYRTLKRAMGRMSGRVAATADVQIAAKAAQTRDRIARAVDRSLGLGERAGKFAARKIPQAAGVLANRIFDNGEPDLPKDAPLTKVAGLRMREIAAYVTTPGAIERDVRIQMAGVMDPDLIAAAEAHRRAVMEHLLQNMPPVPDQGILKTLDPEPSPAQAMSFARRWDALRDPSAVFERLAQEQEMLSLEAAEALRAVYPKLFSQAQQRVVERAAEVNTKIPVRQRVQMTLLYKLPMDSALDPVNFQITQSVYDRKVPIPAPNTAGVAPVAQAAQPAPSIANPVNVSQDMTTAIDRR